MILKFENRPAAYISDIYARSCIDSRARTTPLRRHRGRIAGALRSSSQNQRASRFVSLSSPERIGCVSMDRTILRTDCQRLLQRSGSRRGPAHGVRPLDDARLVADRPRSCIGDLANGKARLFCHPHDFPGVPIGQTEKGRLRRLVHPTTQPARSRTLCLRSSIQARPSRTKQLRVCNLLILAVA